MLLCLEQNGQVCHRQNIRETLALIFERPLYEFGDVTKKNLDDRVGPNGVIEIIIWACFLPLSFCADANQVSRHLLEHRLA